MAAKKLLNTVSVGLGLIFCQILFFSFYFLLFTFSTLSLLSKQQALQGYRGTGVQGCRAAGLQAIFLTKVGGCWGASGRWGAKILLVIFLPFKTTSKVEETCI
jgi:hypothetical protein